MGKKVADDPVYNQAKDQTESSSDQSQNIADDPTYNQPKQGDSGNDHTSVPQTPRKQDGKGEVTEDPTYNQPNATESQSRSQQGIADDPTYNQPNNKNDESAHIADDPTYNQPGTDGSSSQSSSRQPPVKQDGKGEVTEDPTYNQPGATQSQSGSSNQSSHIADDPTYNQPGTHGRNTERSSQQPPIKQDGKGEVTEDPTYNQPGATQSQSQTPPQTRASKRLSQLNNQLAPSPTESDTIPASSANTSKPRQQKRKKNQDYQTLLPADYSDIRGHISTMQDMAWNPPADHRGYTRQKASGKMTSRERIAALLNRGSFREIGSVTGTTKWSADPANPLSEKVEDFVPSNNPQGFGSVTCLRTGETKVSRQVYLTADDFAIRAGHADGAVGPKTLYGEKLALRLKVPVVKLVDGSSGGGSVSTIATTGFSYLPHVTIMSTVVKQLNQGIPNLGAVVGPAIGLGFARVVATHFSVMAADIGSAFNAGPKVVEGATFEEGLSFQDLGGPYVHCCNGTIDNMARDEKECYEQIRTVLGFLPNCGALEAPPCLEAGWSGDDVLREDVSLRTIISRKNNRMYDPYRIIESVVDKSSWFEIGRLWGRTAICGLARLGGKPVAILSNNCEVNSGALDTAGSQKLIKMIKFADIFNLPIVQFVDVRKYSPIPEGLLCPGTDKR